MRTVNHSNADTNRPARRRIVSVVAVGLVSLGCLSIPGQANAASNSSASSSVSSQDNASARSYWNAERMRGAKEHQPAAASNESQRTAAPQVERGEPTGTEPVTGKASNTTAREASASPQASSSEGYWQGSNTSNPNRQVGKLFFQGYDRATRTWKNYKCSGTAVNSENKSVVWTAGHCVYETTTNNWNRNYVFCPGYRNGSCPLGQWTPSRQYTTAQWQNAACAGANGTCNVTEFQYDFGALKMNTLNGNRLVNAVGGHGIKFNGATQQFRYLFGYPGNKSGGEYLYYCSGTNSVSNGTLVLSPCSAGGGASGGPWLSEIASNWMGTVQSVNSYGAVNSSTYMGGPYQGNVALQMFNSVRSA